MDELSAFIDLWVMLFTDPRTGVLLALLLAAAVCDSRTYRIPNVITYSGILFALVYNTVVPPHMHADWRWAAAGLLLALGATLPLYALRALGAGDVKLMAMVGAFLGATDTAYALLFTVLTGGALALLYSAQRHVLLPMLTNIRHTLWLLLWPGIRVTGAPAVESVGRLAYGVSIAVGTAAFVIAHQFGFL